jgi:hypothetical protein
MAFDVDRYAATAAPVRTDDLDFGAFRSQPLSAESLRCLRYMHDVESHTVCYLRDLLLTPSHRDPEITTFLTAWAYEEHWHGAAIGRVLRAHDEPFGAERVGAMRDQLPWRDRFGPYLSALGGLVAGDDFVALHMTWGALNEWSTAVGYDRLAERAAHPVLGELLLRIRRQESRHIAFYATQARDRLARSPRARRLTRFAVRRLWAPVGSGVMPEEETTFLLQWLMGDGNGGVAADRIDANLAALPGMAGLRPVASALSEWLGSEPAAA